MDIDNLKETLTKKYGPLPGYAWVGIGAGGLVLVTKLSKGKGAGTGPVNVSPLSAGGAEPGGSAGGGGGVDLGGGGDVLPINTGGGGDGGTRQQQSDGGGGGTTQSAPSTALILQPGVLDTLHDQFADTPVALIQTQAGLDYLHSQPITDNLTKVATVAPTKKKKGAAKAKPPVKTKKAPELISEHGKGQNHIANKAPAPHVPTALIGSAPVSNSTSVMHVAPVASVAPVVTNARRPGLQIE